MPTARNGFATATMDGKIYVAGGRTSQGFTNIVECYDPINDVWSTKKAMKHEREKFSLFEWFGKLYAIGWVEHLEQYDPDWDEWTVVRTNS